METNYLVDKNRDYAQVLEEYTDAGVQASYIYGKDLISQSRNGVDSFYGYDGLGSTRVLTDEVGGVTDKYTYDAYGRILKSTGTTQNNYLYAGEQFDKGLNQYYLRDRYYGTDIGRFTQRDRFEGNMMNPLSLNRYGYTHGNPVNGIDPSGMFLLSEQAFVMSELTRLVTTAYIVSYGSSSLIGSLLTLSEGQRSALSKANFSRYIPLLREDTQRKGCYSTEIPRLGGHNIDDYLSGTDLPAWYDYSTQVAGTWNDYLVVTPNGIVSTFDGLTPGTRTVWESKYDYGFLLNNSPSADLQAKQLATNIKWLNQRSQELSVAQTCGYNLLWAFSNQYVADFARDELLGEPPPMLAIPYWADVVKKLF